MVERQGHHVARGAFDELTVGRQMSQMIYGRVDIHEVVAGQSPYGAKAQPRRVDSTAKKAKKRRSREDFASIE